MKKNMYSLILAEDVVREIDRLAAAENTNRSNLVNQILADYVSVTTPEKMITDVFKEITRLFKATEELPVSYESHDNTLSIKSALSYRYRPTIRYEVELYRTNGGALGELKVNFRTQSPELLGSLTEFFGLWERLESLYVMRYFGEGQIEYTLDENKWTRTLNLPRETQYDNSALSRAISDYVKVFDRFLKKYLSGGYKSVRELENEYLAALNNGALII